MQGPTRFFIATLGTVMLTSTDVPAGTITDAMFVETDPAGMVIGTGCVSQIDHVAFGRKTIGSACRSRAAIAPAPEQQWLDDLAHEAVASRQLEVAVDDTSESGASSGVLDCHRMRSLSHLERRLRAEEAMGMIDSGFVNHARQFCAFVETAGVYTLAQRLVVARERLLALYEAGARLPQVESTDDSFDGVEREPPAGWPGFERFECYWEVYDPYEEGNLVSGSLTDDFFDIYRDLQRGLARWDRGLEIDAIWEWRFHFDAHWGDHAVDALRALHRACIA